MQHKKRLSLLLALVMAFTLFAGLGAHVQAEVEKFDWKEFDNLIKQSKTETDFAAREGILHQAEDILMDTGAICPLYYYNDVFMAKEDLNGYYSNPYGFKYFAFSEFGDRDTIRLNISSEPDKLDPALNTSVDGACLAVNSFAGLFTYNAEGAVVPDLVDSYEVSEDGTIYTFTLKDDLKWSNGDPLDAHDFEYSWKRAVNWLTAADYSYMFDVIKGYPDVPAEDVDMDEEKCNEVADQMAVKASEDGKTLTVELNSPCAYFLDLCAFPTYYPVHKASVEAADGYRDADGNILQPGAWAVEAGFVSNGAFTCQEWKHNQSIVYVKNPNYHRADDVKVERLEFMLSDDLPVIFSAFQAGDLDFIDSIPVDEIENVKDNPEYHLVDQLGTYFVIFNVNSPMFDGKTVEEAKNMRKAISYCIDRQYIADTVARTGQLIANTFVPEGMADGHGGIFRQNDEDYSYPVEDEVGYFPLEPDLDKAQELLEAAGYVFDENGMLSAETPLNIEYVTNKMESHEKIAECIQQDLAQLGITVNVSQMDWATFQNERKAGNYDVARHGWVADFNDPINFLEMWTTESGNNDAQFGR